MAALNDQRSSWRYLLTELIAAVALVAALISGVFKQLLDTPFRLRTVDRDSFDRQFVHELASRTALLQLAEW
jgi:hypothetical protein